jgi:hypothetical protein
MSLGHFCGNCGEYHNPPFCTTPVNRLAALKPSPKTESGWGFVVLTFFLAMGIVAVFGSCG